MPTRTKHTVIASLAALLLVSGLLVSGPAVASYEAGKKYLERADYRGAAISFSAAAARGDARAQFELAKLFEAGKGVRKDRTRALSLYRRATVGLIPAARRGHADAQFILSGLYRNGLGVKRDRVQALRMLRAAADYGHPKALYQLAIYNEWGVDMPRSDAAARMLYRKAADKGSVKARIMLAARHMTGTGERRDQSQAIEYLEWAARDGTPDDQWAIAGWYGKKVFGAFGQKAALRLTRKAAQRGHVAAQARLSKLYRVGGKGVERNAVRAYVWGRLAERRRNAGKPYALAAARRAPSLTPDQRASAEAWLRKWQPEP
ncbi:MAG: sel1 repeat family protein [Alphaproteobacteria bacterium]|nr:sel1 repeat family protein [Alphaproteobacteria bacterium]